MYFWRLFFYHLGNIKDYFLSSQYSCLRIQWVQYFLLWGYNEYWQYKVVCAVPVCGVKSHSNPKPTDAYEVDDTIQFQTQCSIVYLIPLSPATANLKLQGSPQTRNYFSCSSGLLWGCCSLGKFSWSHHKEGEWWHLTYCFTERVFSFCFVFLSNLGQQRDFK